MHLRVELSTRDLFSQLILENKYKQAHSICSTGHNRNFSQLKTEVDVEFDSLVIQCDVRLLSLLVVLILFTREYLTSKYESC